MNKKKATIKISGLVQGVFFRHSAKLKADELGLWGTVRNEIDDSVLIIIEGESDKINEFIKWARIGPPGAEVRDMDTSWDDYKGDYGNFRIE
jgi:acylphosphatase